MASRAWDDLVDRNALIGFIDINLRGAGQVFFQNNPLTGLIILAAIFWAGCSGGSVSVACGAVVGLTVASLTAILLRADPQSLKQGLLSFNGVLVGAALPTFLARQPLMWACLIIGAAVSTVMTLAIANVAKNWGVPGSTAPFVFTTWLLLLAAYSLARIPIAAMGTPGLPVPRFTTEIHLSAGALASILAKSVSQVYLVENVVTGLLFLVAIAINSLRSAAFAVVGSIVGLIVAAAFGASGSAINAGLWFLCGVDNDGGGRSLQSAIVTRNGVCDRRRHLHRTCAGRFQYGVVSRWHPRFDIPLRSNHVDLLASEHALGATLSSLVRCERSVLSE